MNGYSKALVTGGIIILKIVACFGFFNLLYVRESPFYYKVKSGKFNLTDVRNEF
jgi:hypothetical protein